MSGDRDREVEVLERIERMRRSEPRLRDERITMAHGAGGRASRTLVEALFLEAFRNPLLEPLEDQAVLGVEAGRLAFTTDAFVVSPLEFAGGSIGHLAVNGTVNDLAVAGACPLHLSAAFVLEEGLLVATLQRVVADMAAAAREAGVAVVTGDTKVVEAGKADGCYIVTSGVGLIGHGLDLGASRARPGDAVVVSGPIGDHGVAVMVARGELGIDTPVASDTAPLHELVADLLRAGIGIRAMRDATRGGVATVLNEIAAAAGVAVTLEEPAIPVRPEVLGACEILGIDPLYVACEGRLVAIVDPADADRAVEVMRARPEGEGAAVIGSVAPSPSGMVMLETTFGGTRIVDTLVGDPLPRIC